MLKNWLGKKGFKVNTASSITKARKHIEAYGIPNLVLSDLRLPDGDGLQLLEWLCDQQKLVPVIIMTGYADIQSAVQAIKEGAKDYISKPIQPDELLRKIQEVLAETPSSSIHSREPANASQPSLPHKFIEGVSKPARQLYHYASLVAPTNMSVLICGASGTGKEYIAHRIHRLSPRANKPFVAIDCGAIPKELAASEFFGHIKGSFTGALTDKTGAFEAANGGTLFLDEIGNLDYETQQRLLRALQERKIRPVGSTKEISVDVRLLSATNEDLEAGIGKGSFREDLFHRINEFTLSIPSLNQCPEDVAIYADFFLSLANRELNRNIKGFTPDALLALQRYPWPGNLRQMKYLIKRAALLTTDSHITPDELDKELMNNEFESPILPLYDENDERKRIIDALNHAGKNKSQAARLLGIDRKTLYNKLKTYCIEE